MLRQSQSHPTSVCAQVRFAFIFLVIAGASPAVAQPNAPVTHGVTVTFSKSSLSDFLFYILDRSTGPYKDLPAAAPLTNVPHYQPFSFLPQTAELAGLTDFAQVYGKVDADENRAALVEVLHAAEPLYPTFETYWRKRIEPDETRAAQVWSQQLETWRPIERLQALERLPFPFKSLRIDVFGTESQGGSMQGPPVIFTTPSVPDVAWVIGHEGTHMMLGPKGADIPSRPNGPAAIARITKAGGSEYAIEEAMCLLMQAKLSMSFGGTPQSFRTSATLVPSATRTLLVALEADWDAFQKGRQNAADWLISETLRTFPA
jgi:hypothetical protein